MQSLPDFTVSQFNSIIIGYDSSFDKDDIEYRDGTHPMRIDWWKEMVVCGLGRLNGNYWNRLESNLSYRQ